MNKYLLRGISILSGAGLVFSGLAPVNVYAASTQSSSLAYRTKVINLTGIYTGEASEETVTRGEFAKMTVLASSYKDTVTGSNTVNVFSDVSKDHENSEYIRVAARQGYMRSFLGGSFKPDEGVTLNDAAKAVLSDISFFEGRVVTGDAFVNSDEKRAYLRNEFNGLCCEMEGGAIAHVCHVNKVPFLIIRAISDSADNSSHMDYEVFEKNAIENSVKLSAAIAERF